MGRKRATLAGSTPRMRRHGTNSRKGFLNVWRSGAARHGQTNGSETKVRRLWM